MFGTLAILALLVPIVALLCESVQSPVRRALNRRPALVALAPVALTALFAACAWKYGAAVWPLTGMMALYTAVPTVLISIFRDNPTADLAAILALWLPLEFSAGARYVPRSAQGFLHTIAYGVAIALALWLFLLFRNLPGMKYRLPRSWRDLVLPLAAFGVVGPLLIVLGRALGFMGPFRIPPGLTPISAAWRFLWILAATALPEEILFRGLIQNWLTLRMGDGWPSLALAAVVFGCSHLNNLAATPGPSWTYMMLATIAGLAFGWVFRNASSILASAALHALVNTTRHVFFR